MNVLFIICHDISPRFGCYGHPLVQTPHIDRLAARGVRFDSHFCQAPICSASRANIFSGCRPETTKHYRFDPFWQAFRERTGFPTLGEHLRAHGYTTVALNQVMHGRDDDAPSWNRQWWPERAPVPDWSPGSQKDCEDAFDHYREPSSLALMKERMEAMRDGGEDPASNIKRWRGPAFEAAAPGRIPYEEEPLTGRAAEELAALKKGGRPFFLGVGYQTGHLPWCAPRAYYDLYPREKIVLPANMAHPEGAPEYAAYVNEPAQYYTTTHYKVPWFANREQAVDLLQAYYASISYFDAQVGRLLDAMDANGLWENTAVVLTTDHGYAVGEHRHWGKVTLWEPDTHVPLIVAAPAKDSNAGRATARLTEHVDLYPTICELAGVERPAHLEGCSAVPLLDNPERPWKRAAFSNYGRPYAKHERMGRAIRTEGHRLVRWTNLKTGTVDAVELYDKKSDPLETVNIAARPESAATVARLSAWIDEGWRASLPAGTA